MGALEAYIINLEDIGETPQTFHYNLNDAYFQAVGDGSIHAGEVDADVIVMRQGTNFKIEMSLSGSVTIDCDICLDPMQQPIEAQTTLVATLGTEYNDDGDTIIIDEQKGEIDLSWLLYEQVALAIPLKHVHEQGKCNPQMLSAVNAFEHHTDRQQEDNTLADERWNELKKLKTIFKD